MAKDSRVGPAERALNPFFFVAKPPIGVHGCKSPPRGTRGLLIRVELLLRSSTASPRP